MGFWDRLTNIFNTQGRGIIEPENKGMTLVGGTITTETSKDFIDSIPFRINRSIKNFRYAYKHDSTVNSTINNLIILSNIKFNVVADNPEYNDAVEHIEKKIEEWDLSNFIDEFIKRNLIDGCMFINRYIENGSIKLKILANDGERYKWKIIRDPATDEIIGYKQLIIRSKPVKNWKTADFDEIVEEPEEVTITFMPEEIIYSTWMEDGGVGTSILYPVLELVEVKANLEHFLLLSAHKAGVLLGVQLGNEDVSAEAVDDVFIKQVMKWFSKSNKKDVVAYPYGLEPQVIGNSTLPDYINYLKYIKSEIRNVLLTPDSKFSSTTTNRSTAKEQLNSDTGYAKVIEYIQEFVCNYINREIIDKELELHYPDAVGKVKIEYINYSDENIKNLSNIGVKLMNILPNLNSELIIKSYFPDYANNYYKYKRLFGDDVDKYFDKEMGKLNVTGDNTWNTVGMNTYNMNQKIISDRQKRKKQEERLGEDIYKDV